MLPKMPESVSFCGRMFGRMNRPKIYTSARYVDITAHANASVTLDGQPVANFQPIGTSGFSLARVTPLNNGPLGDGNHSITGSEPFGIQVYGYGMDTSYWYPGGLDLDLVPIGRTAPPASPAAAFVPAAWR